MEVGHGPVVDSEVFTDTTLKSTVVSKTIGRIEFTPNDENRWRVPFNHPEIDNSAKADFTVESKTNSQDSNAEDSEGSTSQSGLHVTYKGITNFAAFFRNFAALSFSS